ncbi:MAG: zinc ABC transporter substrate-binding protein [Candidatus Omnitrophica bacterium]|nr:zinc ABC transporter substrate-binding protein [Candidatus Omnitrophota bacterium]
MRAKILLSVVIGLVFSWAFSVNYACASDGPVKIITSFYPVYIMAINVAKDVPGVSVTNLTPSVTGCLHDYAVTTRDMKKLADAHVFVANGAGMESFLDRIVAQYPAIKVVTLAARIPLLKGTSGDNPHVWVSVTHAITEVERLGDALAGIDPVHAPLYQKNAAEYVGKLQALREKMRAALVSYRGRDIVTFHEAFSYFAEEFGFHIAAVVEREPGSQPSARELSQTIDIIKKSRIKALFSEPQYPALAAKTIARETGIEVYILDPAVSGPDDLDAYIQIMEKNCEVLEYAFSK